MTTTLTTPAPARADALDAIAQIMAQAGLTAADLHPSAPPVMDVAGYVARFLPTISQGSARAYGTYLTRFAEDYGDRALADITVTDIHAFTADVQTTAVATRGTRINARGGRSAKESAITGLRAMFARAIGDRLITDNPALQVRKPPRPRRTRSALTADQLTALYKVTATGGDDPELDALLTRFLVETGARREGVIALRRRDLDHTRATVLLREKNDKDGTEQPVSPSLLAALDAFATSRGATADHDSVFRYRPRDGATVGAPLTRRRFDTLTKRWRRELLFGTRAQVSPHVLRHTAIGLVEMHSGYAVARAFARHQDHRDVTTTYLQRGITDVACAVQILTGENHPLAEDRWNLSG